MGHRIPINVDHLTQLPLAPSRQALAMPQSRHLINDTPDVPFGILKANRSVHFTNDSAIPPDEDGRWQPRYAVNLGYAVITEKDRVVDAHISCGFCDSRYLVLGTVVHSDSANLKTERTVAPLQFDKAGNLGLARWTPCSPEVQHDHFAMKVCETDVSAINRGQHETRRHRTLRRARGNCRRAG